MGAMDFNLLNFNGIGCGAGFSPVTIPFASPIVNPFFDNSMFMDFSNPFSGAFAYPSFDDNFMSNIAMFDLFLTQKMTVAQQNKIFDTDFNTRTDLLQLQSVYNPSLGNSLANIANKNATRKNSRHLCLQGVRESLNKAGLVEGRMGASAYQAINVLANHKNFKEVSVSRADLKNLPAGCIIVWDKNNSGTKSSDLHGHIAITLGDGREASDHVANRTYMLNSKHRVFVPVGMDRAA